MEELWQEVSDELSRLTDRVERLSSLIEVGAIISSSLDLNEVLQLVMAKAQAVMESETCSILLLNEDTDELEFVLTLGNDEEIKETLRTFSLKMGQGVAGWCAQHRRSVIIEDTSKDERFFPGVDDATGFVTRSLIAVPLIHQDRLIGVAEVINPLLKDAFDESDLELFETFCRQVAIAIDNARFHQAFLAQQRLKEQLEVAATIQDSFLPAERPDPEGDNFRLQAITLPAQEVGGDLYDYFMLPGGRLAALIGDVAGKGVGAALYMAKVVSEFRYLARLLPDPAEVIGRLNRSLCESARLGMFVTGVYLILDIHRGDLLFCNAGHLPSLVRRRSSGAVEMVEGKAGPPMGVVPEAVYTASRLALEPGDRLLMLTDGIIESWNQQREQFGFERLIELVAAAEPDQPVVNSVVEAVRSWSQGLPPHDDLTLLELAWLGSEDGREEGPSVPCLSPEAEFKEQNLVLDVGLTPRMLAVVRDVTERMASLAGFEGGEAAAIKLAVDEACSNVLRHAYCGDTSRRLRINFTLTPDSLISELHDFGIGFDPNSVPAPDLENLKPGGLGIHLMRTVMDEIDYVQSDLEGNTLRLVKFRPSEGGSSVDDDQSE